MRTIPQTGVPNANRFNDTVLNTISETIPPYAIMQVVGCSNFGADRIYHVTQPSANDQYNSFAPIYLLNGPTSIVGYGYGAATNQFPAEVRYAGETPFYGAEWGPVPGQWTISHSGKGYLIVGGANQGIVRVMDKAGSSAGDDFPIVRIYNDSGLAMPLGSVVAYGPPLDPPPGAFTRLPAFKSSLPKAGKPFCVLFDPAEPNQIVDAAPLGVVTVLIDYTDTDHTHADCIVDDYSRLRSTRTGPAQILWREKQDIAGGGTLGMQWARVLLKHDNYRMVRGRAYEAVESDDARFEINNIVPLCGGLDPRSDPTTGEERIWVANYHDETYNSGETVYAVYIGKHTDPDAEWEAMPKPGGEGASGTFVCKLNGTISAGTINAMGPGDGTVYSIEGATLTSLGTHTIYNPFRIALPSSAAGSDVLYTCAKTSAEDDPANDKFTITGIDPLHLLAFLDGFGATKALYSDGGSVTSIKWGGGACPT